MKTEQKLKHKFVCSMNNNYMIHSNDICSLKIYQLLLTMVMTMNDDDEMTFRRNCIEYMHVETRNCIEYNKYMHVTIAQFIYMYIFNTDSLIYGV